MTGAEEPAFSRGQSIGPYELVRFVGRGGLGRVFEARHRESGQRVAIKFLSEDGDPTLLKRFRREVKILGSLQNRHVATYVSGDLNAHPPYLAMGFVDGLSLLQAVSMAQRQHVSETSTLHPLPQTLQWATDMACGLAAIHRLQIVHRDLKPSNVMIDTEGRAVLIDFGLARLEGATTVTQSCECVGTYLYLSPEHLNGDRITTQSDVYQWALIVHELLTGDLPHPSDDPVQMVSDRFEHGVSLPRFQEQGLASLAALVERSLSPDPAARPQSGEDLLHHLERADDPQQSPDEREQALVVTEPEGLAVPSKISKSYEIVRLIGKGGMGAVYEGRHRLSGERVAIKLLRPTLLSDPTNFVRFQREAELLTGFLSPRIVKILDHSHEEKRPYLIMEYLEGETLASRLERCGPFPVDQTLEIMVAMTEGIAELHTRGVIHRDLKPANLILTTRSGPKILDLGIAKNVSETRITRTGMGVGTLAYTTPEMLHDGTSSLESDVYQLGLILFELLTGQRDFRSSRASDVLRGVLFRDGTLRSGEAQTIIDRLVELFRRATARNPQDRFPNAQRMLSELLEVRKCWNDLTKTAHLDALDERRTRSDKRGSPPLAVAYTDEVSKGGRVLATITRLLGALLVVAVLVTFLAVLWFLPELLRRIMG